MSRRSNTDAREGPVRVTRCVALLRGINVGKAKRIAMADLRAAFGKLGYADVRTLLNSGNVVFSAPGRDVAGISAVIEKAIVERFGFSVRVVVVTGEALKAIVSADPLSGTAVEPTRYLVAFFADGAAPAAVTSLSAQSWAPEAFAMAGSVAYLWCANGIAESKLVLAFFRAAGESATTRNWATVLKLLAAALPQESTP